MVLKGVKVRGSRNCNECGREDSVELIANEDGLWRGSYAAISYL